MNQRMELSNNTQEYLERFYSVLDTMINGMTAVQPTDSVSMDFIHQMIPHHRAAIQMSENLLRYTTNIPLQNIAKPCLCDAELDPFAGAPLKRFPLRRERQLTLPIGRKSDDSVPAAHVGLDPIVV